MARSFHHSLLAAVVACVVSGQVVAQSQLKEAVNAIRLGKPEEAKTILQELLQSDPSNEDALQYYQSVSQDEYYMLLTDNDDAIRKFAQSILERAKVERQEESRDADTINALVETATQSENFGERQDAVNKLIANHGEFAVPALVERLGNPDDIEGSIKAIYTLTQLNTVAVLPLIEALKSSNEITVQNAAAALYHIGDMRAAPVMARLAGDSRVPIAQIAKRFLKANNVTRSDTELAIAQAKEYIAGGIASGAFSDVIWSLNDDKLEYTDVPALVYQYELAKSVAADAVAAAPQSEEAIATLASANLAEISVIESSIKAGDESAAELAAIVPELRIAANASGVQAVRKVLEDGMKDGLKPIAVEAAMILADAEGQDTVGQSSLIQALDSSDKRVKYAAAAALVKASNGANVPAAGKVVRILAEAVAEEQVRSIQVISPETSARQAVMAASDTAGLGFTEASSGVRGMQNLLINPRTDVVVINEILPDRLPEDVIGNVKKDSRMANARIVIVAKDPAAAEERFGDAIHGVVQAPLSGEALVAEVNRVLEGVPNPAGDRAEGYAAGASTALNMMAANGSSVSAALTNLAAQLDRGDAVAVPAAKALGLAGTADQLDAVRGALVNGSDAVKVAAADAMAGILGRMDSAPEAAIEALLATVQGDGSADLRGAAARALGRAKLSGREKADVQQKLRKIAGTN